MKELIWQFTFDVLLWTVFLYIFIIIINILLRLSTGKPQDEPNIWWILLLVFAIELIKLIYNHV